MKLDIPYTSQQNNEIRNDCGPACAAMLINAYTDQVVTIDDYYADLDIIPGSYQAVGDLQHFLSAFGVESVWTRSNTFRNVQNNIDAGRPCIALIAYKPLSDAGLTYYKGSFTHFVVISGATDTEVIIHDPYYPDDSGAYVSIPRDVFQQAWDSVPPANGPHGGAIVCVDRLEEFTDMPYEPGMYQCIADTLNVRSGPGTNYPIVGYLHEGDIETVTEVFGNWGRLGTGERYASLSYMKEIETPPQPGDPLIIKVTRTGQQIVIDLPPGVDVEYQ